MREKNCTCCCRRVESFSLHAFPKTKGRPSCCRRRSRWAPQWALIVVLLVFLLLVFSGSLPLLGLCRNAILTLFLEAFLGGVSKRFSAPCVVTHPAAGAAARRRPAGRGTTTTTTAVTTAVAIATAAAIATTTARAPPPPLQPPPPPPPRLPRPL